MDDNKIYKVELPNGSLYDIAGSGGGSINLVAGNYEYSEEEQIIGKWIDGKPIYKLTLHDPNSYYGNVEILADAYKPPVDTLISLTGSATSASGLQMQLPYVHTTTGLEIGIFYSAYSNPKSYGLRAGSSYSATYQIHDIYLVLLYTKTTDEPNSFKPEMISAVEIPVKHKYSTEEKVVGEWIDGKPIYERTIEIYFDSEDYTYNVENIETPISCNTIFYVTSATTGKSSVLANPINIRNLSNYSCSSWLNGTSIRLTIGTGFNITGKAVSTIQYTKITD